MSFPAKLLGLCVCLLLSAPIFAACVFPDAQRQEAPAWVCATSNGHLLLQAVGAATWSNAGVQFVKDQAVAAARVKLARQLQHLAGQRIRRFVDAEGGAAGRRPTAPTLRECTRQTLLGSRLLEQVRSGKGTLYVLVGFDETQQAAALTAVIRDYIARQPAVWRPWLNGRGAEALAEAVTSGR